MCARVTLMTNGLLMLAMRPLWAVIGPVLQFWNGSGWGFYLSIFLSNFLFLLRIYKDLKKSFFTDMRYG